MVFFGRKKKDTSGAPASGHYDPDRQEPVIRCSICTGEQVAGFRDRKTGSITEILLIRSPEDLESFRKEYGLGDVEILKVY